MRGYEVAERGEIGGCEYLGLVEVLRCISRQIGKD